MQLDYMRNKHKREKDDVPVDKESHELQAAFERYAKEKFFDLKPSKTGNRTYESIIVETTYQAWLAGTEYVVSEIRKLVKKEGGSSSD